jgi:hypothetical protein
MNQIGNMQKSIAGMTVAGMATIKEGSFQLMKRDETIRKRNKNPKRITRTMGAALRPAARRAFANSALVIMGVLSGRR